MDSPPGNPETDAAWVTVELPVPAHAVTSLLGNPALLLRLNPCLEFERLGSGSENRLHVAARNESNGCRVDTEVTIDEAPGRTRVTFRYSEGIKRESRFQVEPAAGGCRLTITEVYSPPGGEPTEAQLGEVDRSLVPWAAAIRRHLVRMARFGFLPGFRWFACHFWPSMSPQHRRIAWLITWTTALEFVIFAVVLAVYLSAGK